jgi:hypothetical protein
VLEATVRQLDTRLLALTQERDALAVEVQRAAWAYHQAKRDARQLAGQVRQAARHARQAVPSEIRDAMARLDEYQRALAVLVGAHEAERIAQDAGYSPPWLRGG